MEAVTLLKLEQDKKALQKITKILYQDKNFILDKLIIYLKINLNIDYYKYKIIDIDNNIVDILVKKDSVLFKNFIEGKDCLNFNSEELIDNRKFKNEDDVIIIDFSLDEQLLNLSYLCDSLSYDNLSYSKEIKDTISTFINYVINKKIYNM